MKIYDSQTAPNPRRVRIFLAEKGIQVPYEQVDIVKADNRSAEFRRKNPLGTLPVLELDDGTCIAQSNAILWYLGEGSRYMPQTAFERGEVLQWLSFEQERVMSGIGSARFRIVTGRDTGVVPARLALGLTALESLERRLDYRRWLVGDRCSIADVSIYAYAHTAPDAGYDLSEYPAVARWLELVEAEPGFVNDLAPYPENARPGSSASIYDG